MPASDVGNLAGYRILFATPLFIFRRLIKNGSPTFFFFTLFSTLVECKGVDKDRFNRETMSVLYKSGP